MQLGTFFESDYRKIGKLGKMRDIQVLQRIGSQ